MIRVRIFSAFLGLNLLSSLISACADSPLTPTATPETSVVSQSHSSETEPDYAVVFSQDAVNRIDITLSAEAWSDLQNEMEEQFGKQGNGEGGPGGQAPKPPQPGNFADGRPPGGPGGGMGAMDFGDTSYVPSTVQFNGETWNSVGFRYSGNSTLQTSWRSGTKKISFRLDFDEFEDQNPTTKNQRFYGFKQLSFKSNAMDSTYLREKATGDIFRAAGVIAPQTAFYEVYVDYGEGAQYFGLYTVVEIVDDTLIKTAFSNDSGNLYKPEGSGATFAKGTFSEEAFEKQTNKKEADWSDIQALFTALHADTRTSDPAAWRAGLEAVFDVDSFLRWLAADTILQNWDTYGAMAHNYYLYHDPSSGLLTWIPWDNNMALSASPGGPGDHPRQEQNVPKSDQSNPLQDMRAAPGKREVRQLDLSSVSAQWPLIYYLADDPIYMAKYQQYLKEISEGAFQPDRVKAAYQAYHDLIASYVEKETRDATQLESYQQFEQALEPLIQHAYDRYTAVQAYLSKK